MQFEEFLRRRSVSPAVSYCLLMAALCAALLTIFMFFLGNSSRFDNRRKRRTAPPFIISNPERHLYILGKTGTGKSQILLSLLHQTIKTGLGCAFIDPHGDTARQLLEHIPKWRQKDVIYFNPADTEQPLGFNLLQSSSPSEIVDAFHSVFSEIGWGAQMEMFLNASLSALSFKPDGTLLGINKMFTDERFRKRVISYVTDSGIRYFWEHDFKHMPDREQRERSLSTLNKVGLFITDYRLRNILGQPHTSFTIKDNTILIANLSQGQLGQRKSALLASLLLSHLHSFALKRQFRMLFPIVLDEFQLYGALTLTDMLSGIRKFGVSLIMANQSLTQLPLPLRSAILANVDTICTLQTGPDDAKALEPLFHEDIVDLPAHHALVRSGTEVTKIHVPEFQARRRDPRPIIRRCRALSPGRKSVEARLRRYLL